MDKIKYRGLEGAKPCRSLHGKEITELTKALALKHEGKNKNFNHVQLINFRDRIRSEPIPRVLIGRIEPKGLRWYDITDMELLMFLGAIEEAADNAVATMWAYTLLLWSTDLERAVSIFDFTDKYFTNCVPTKMASNKAWQGQKGETLNVKCWGDADDALDMSTLWLPLIEQRLAQLNKTTTNKT